MGKSSDPGERNKPAGSLTPPAGEGLFSGQLASFVFTTRTILNCLEETTTFYVWYAPESPLVTLKMSHETKINGLYLKTLNFITGRRVSCILPHLCPSYANLSAYFVRQATL